MTLANEELLTIYRHLHQFPELGLEEFKTHDYLLTIIQQLPQDYLQIKEVDALPTALLVKVSGKSHKRLIGYRTDIDALPVKEKKLGYHLVLKLMVKCMRVVMIFI